MKKHALEEVVEAHGLWVRSGTLAGARADLTGELLVEADVSGKDLRWALLRGSRWRGAVLRGTRLAGADLQGAVPRGADLRDADLVRANLRGADLRDADLRGARFVDRVGTNELDLPRDVHAADLTGAQLDRAQVARSALVGTGATGPHEHACEGPDPFALPTPQAEPALAPAPSWTQPVKVVLETQPAQVSKAAMQERGHDRATLLSIARTLARAFPQLDDAVASCATPSWTRGLGEHLDAYEWCAVSAGTSALSIHVHIARCDTIGGPVETGRTTTFSIEFNAARVALVWSGTGRLVVQAGGDSGLVDQLKAAGVSCEGI